MHCRALPHRVRQERQKLAARLLFVALDPKGHMHWMEVRDWLKHGTRDGQKRIRQIPFEGERLEVMSIRRWRDKVLGEQATHIGLVSQAYPKATPDTAALLDLFR
ncbi:MAG: hypothetical protein DMG65_12245 [Candidatus Angelobacter sp. Gp1-AA117]|nr:MAG: hypothetical protein DMG65_12245 [Candidatus Angelobacter sp. Gp1-AA117]